MAAAPAHFPQGFFKLCSLFFLAIICCALLGTGATVKVTQEPLFASTLQKGRRTLSCSHSESSTYNFFWYRQLSGGKELKHIGSLFEYSEHLTESKGWLSGQWLENGKKMSLELQGPQPSDTGLYLCAVRDPGAQQAYFAATGTQLIVEDEACQRSQPTVHLLGPVCHKDHVTLVCVAQGFPYEWPIDVSWKRDAQEVTRLSVATDPVRTLNGTCNFGVSSRLSMTAAEWQERHVYSCHVRQGNIAEAEESMEREPSQQSASTVLEFQSSLHTGQVIFLLLVVKSFAYGTALGIYTACKKKTGL